MMKSLSWPTSVVICAARFPLVSLGDTQTETDSMPSKYGASIAPPLKKFAEITVPLMLSMTSGLPLVGGTVVPVTSCSQAAGMAMA